MKHLLAALTIGVLCTRAGAGTLDRHEGDLLFHTSVGSTLLAAVPLSGAPPGSAVAMPGSTYDRTPPPLAATEQDLSHRLRAHVYALAVEIGERNWPHYDGLERARHYIEGQLRAAGYAVGFQPFELNGETFYNVEAVLGTADGAAPSIVVGAHYDSVEGSPGANDNASGVAALLELARRLNGRRLATSIRFVAFVNEEPPYFNRGEGMGSVEYVRAIARPADRIRAMLALETVGLYRDEPGSQHYPPLVGLFYPQQGNFIAFVGDLASAALVRQAIGAFRRGATLPSEGAALPSFVPGITWSDHRSFSDAGIPALMVTDTAPFRDPHYHLASDTPGRLDYTRMARLVLGLDAVIVDLAASPAGRTKK